MQRLRAGNSFPVVALGSFGRGGGMPAAAGLDWINATRVLPRPDVCGAGKSLEVQSIAGNMGKLRRSRHQKTHHAGFPMNKILARTGTTSASLSGTITTPSSTPAATLGTNWSQNQSASPPSLTDLGNGQYLRRLVQPALLMLPRGRWARRGTRPCAPQDQRYA